MRITSLAGAGVSGLSLVFTLASSGATEATTLRPVVPRGFVNELRQPTQRRSDAATTCSTESSAGVIGISGAGDVAGGNYTGVLAGKDNTACDGGSGIVAGIDNVVGSGSADTAVSSVIGGGYENGITEDDAFIGAGQGNLNSGIDSAIGAGLDNTITSTISFIGAGGGPATGAGNTISGSGSFIGAGEENSVAATYAAIGGGVGNTVTSAAADAAIGGGNVNYASGVYAAIGGGSGNKAEGAFAVIPGGADNEALGAASFASGYHAEASHAGSFVWSDDVSGSSDVTDSAGNQFVVRASGGVFVYSSEKLTSGVELAAGSGTWASLSDRNAKTDIVPLDDASILAKVANLPIDAWQYKTERGVRHVGPMAQDFYAAFGVGSDNRHITSIDEDGVALAAVKAVHRENGRLRATIAALTEKLDRLSATVARLR